MKKYQVKDHSLAAPVYMKYFSDPLMKIIPRGIPANIITILSFLCMTAALVITFLQKKEMADIWFMVPLLILFYATGDIIDGKQARKTNTSSVLGEFLDHFFDIFINGMLLTMLFTVFEKPGLNFISFYFVLSYITLAAIYFEQHKNNMLYFEKLGPFEAIIVLTVLITLGLTDFSYYLSEYLIYGSLAAIDLVLAGIGAGAFITMCSSIKRQGQAGKPEFIIFLAASSAAAFFSSSVFTREALMAVMTLYCGSYVGLLHTSHLAGEKEPLPDIFYPMFLAAGPAAGISLDTVVLISFIYLSIIFIMELSRGFILFGRDWRWKNPV